MKFIPVMIVASLLPAIVVAAPTVTFQGEVTSQTCEASINGATNSFVLLPSVPVSAFDGAGSSAGLTPFTISLTGCQAPTTGPVAISTKFLGRNVTAAGNLGNAASGDSATDVVIQLTTTAQGTAPIVLNGVTAVPGLVLQSGANTATYDFGAQYFTEGGNPTAGQITGVAEYTLSYP